MDSHTYHLFGTGRAFQSSKLCGSRGIALERDFQVCEKTTAIVVNISMERCLDARPNANSRKARPAISRRASTPVRSTLARRDLVVVQLGRRGWGRDVELWSPTARAAIG